MQWILLGAVIIALLLMASRSPKIAISLLVLLIIFWTAFYYYTKNVVKIDQDLADQGKVSVSGFKLTPGYRDSYNLSARLNNHTTTHTITEVRLRISLEDCPKNDQTKGPSCIVVGNIDEIISIIIPPRQARDITRNPYFGAVQLQGKPHWTYKITGLKTKSSQIH